MGWQWKQVREHYREQMRAAQRKQKEIAAAGGIPQSAVSKLLHNDKLGPAVQIFLNAIAGLGIPVSEFFAQLERATPPDAEQMRRVFISYHDVQTRELAQILQRIIRYEIESTSRPAEGPASKIPRKVRVRSRKRAG